MSFAAPRLCKVRPGWLCITALLTAHWLLGIDAAQSLTVTHDEYWHLPAGLAAWKLGRFDADNLNPPLTRLWDALPLLCTAAAFDPATPPGDAFQLGDRFLTDNRPHYERYLALTRSMNLLFSVLLGGVLAVWAYELFGMKSACLAAALWAFCPTALANAALVTPDMGAAFEFTCTLFFCWRFAKHPNWRRAAGLGILLGLAQLTKFTNLLLYPLCAMTWLVVRVGSCDVSPATWKKQLGNWCLLVAVSLGVLNAGYLFRGSFEGLNEYQFKSDSMIRLAKVLGPMRTAPVPLPRDYLEGLDRQRQIMEGPHPVYLDGEWNQHGFGTYYLRALAYKLPHGAQALMALTLFCIVWPGRLHHLGRVQGLLLLPVLAIIAVASSIGMQLGIRYLLPAFPLLFLWASQAARWLDWQNFRYRTVLLVALIAALPWSLRFHPHHLAYFNELSGGPPMGRKHLLDSNLDWGQDLRGLALYLDQQQIGEIGLAYFGMLPPSELGIKYHLPPSWRPEPGWYAVSVNFSSGRPHTIRNPDGTLRSVNFREFAYFSDFKPVAQMGYSIDVYHISTADIARWFAR